MGLLIKLQESPFHHHLLHFLPDTGMLFFKKFPFPGTYIDAYDSTTHSEYFIPSVGLFVQLDRFG